MTYFDIFMTVSLGLMCIMMNLWWNKFVEGLKLVQYGVIKISSSSHKEIVWCNASDCLNYSPLMRISVQWSSSQWWMTILLSLRFSHWPGAMEGKAAQDSDTVTLVAEGRHFLCKKTKLMNRSDYFKAMFSSNFSENDKKLIELQVTAYSSHLQPLTK